MVRILTDGTSCIPPTLGRQKGIVVVPHLLNFSGQIYREWLDLDVGSFAAKLNSSDEIPTTFPAPVDDFVEAMDILVESGEPVICLGASKDVSHAFNNMQEAAHHFPGADIRVIDTRLTSSILGTLVLLAAEWAAEGQSADVIEKRVRNMIPKSRIYFLVPSLAYLAKGGRVGNASLWLNDFLQLKPILTLTEGRVDRYETVRTYQHGIIKLRELVLTHVTCSSNNYVAVSHVGALEEAQGLARCLQDALRLAAVPIYDISPSIVCNTGPGTIGVSFCVTS